MRIAKSDNFVPPQLALLNYSKTKKLNWEKVYLSEIKSPWKSNVELLKIVIQKRRKIILLKRQNLQILPQNQKRYRYKFHQVSKMVFVSTRERPHQGNRGPGCKVSQGHD